MKLQHLSLSIVLGALLWVLIIAAGTALMLVINR